MGPGTATKGARNQEPGGSKTVTTVSAEASAQAEQLTFIVRVMSCLF